MAAPVCARCKKPVEATPDLVVARSPLFLRAFHNACYAAKAKAFFGRPSPPLNTPAFTAQASVNAAMGLAVLIGLRYLRDRFSRQELFQTALPLLPVLDLLSVFTAVFFLPLLGRLWSYFTYERPLHETGHVGAGGPVEP